MSCDHGDVVRFPEFSISAIFGNHGILPIPNEAARRKFAAPQTVIVSDRRLPGVERSRLAKPTSAALCLRPSARCPPPIDVLLQIKTQVQFDRLVTRLSKSLFSVFRRSNLVIYQSLFATRCRPFGR